MQMHARATAHRTGIQCRKRGGHHLRIHLGIGIQKQQAITLGGLGAGIAGGGDMPQLHLDHASAVGTRDRRGVVAAGIGHHDGFVVQLHGLRAGMQALQRLPDQRGLVMGGNHAGEHCSCTRWPKDPRSVQGMRGPWRELTRPQRLRTRGVAQRLTAPIIASG